jgi:hypothetical protein
MPRDLTSPSRDTPTAPDRAMRRGVVSGTCGRRWSSQERKEGRGGMEVSIVVGSRFWATGASGLHRLTFLRTRVFPVVPGSCSQQPVGQLVANDHFARSAWHSAPTGWASCIPLRRPAYPYEAHPNRIPGSGTAGLGEDFGRDGVGSSSLRAELRDRKRRTCRQEVPGRRRCWSPGGEMASSSFWDSMGSMSLGGRVSGLCQNRVVLQ